MYIENLYIESTRRCPLSCEHCLRGDAQNIDMSKETLENIFNGIKQVDYLLITGGEPLSAVNTLKELIRIIKKNNVKINMIKLITNGTCLSNDVLEILMELSQTSILDLKVSNDIFHTLELDRLHLRERRDSNLITLKQYFNAEEYGEGADNQYLIKGLMPMGRAKSLTQERLNEINKLSIYNYIINKYSAFSHTAPYFENNKLNGMIYVDVNGNLARCYLSYELADEECSMIRINVNEMPFCEAVNSFISYLSIEEEKEHVKIMEMLGVEK